MALLFLQYRGALGTLTDMGIMIVYGFFIALSCGLASIGGRSKRPCSGLTRFLPAVQLNNEALVLHGEKVQ